MNKIISKNPSTGEVLGEVKISSEQEIVQKVNNARKAFDSWKNIGLSERISILRNVSENLTKRADELANLSSKEMGMPISQTVHDVHGAIDYFNWYLDNAEKYLSPEVTFEDDSMKHTVYYEPVGVVAAITPWNFPASNFIWMVGQALIAGNTVVFKDSEEVPLCGKLIEEIMNESGLPSGVFSEIYGAGNEGGILLDQNIDMICFTGSTATGQKLYKVAANKFIKVLLELGGSAPGIVLEDADVDKVLETIYANRFDNCGQICDGLKRLIVHESKFEEVIEKLSTYLDQVVVGNSSNEKTDIGPLVSEKQLENLKAQVADAIEKGAKVEYKKELQNLQNGNFYTPTILTAVTKDMQVWNEEVFGPVLPVVTFKTEEEAIILANDTKYGLGGYIFTENKDKFKELALKIDSGMIQANNTSYVTPESPFGGCKLSGIGREHGKFGFRDVTEVKLVSEEK